MKRRKSLPVRAGSVIIGGDAPVSVQTMSTVNPAHMAEAVVDARRLASYGAEILRFAVPDMEAAKGLAAVVQAVVGCLLFGMLWDRENYIGMVVVAVISVAAFLLCVIYRKKIDKYLDRIYEKISR